MVPLRTFCSVATILTLSNVNGWTTPTGLMTRQIFASSQIGSRHSYYSRRTNHLMARTTNTTDNYITDQTEAAQIQEELVTVATIPKQSNLSSGPNFPTRYGVDDKDMTNFNKSDLIESLFLGIQPTPEIIAIMAIYFVEGALGLARLAQTFFLKDTLHLGPSELAALTGLFTIPWTIKPLYGFLSDGLPLFGYRRRSYLILCGLLGATSYTALGTNFFGIYGDSGGDIMNSVITVGSTTISLVQATVAAFIISSACIAFSDVVADGIVVQRTRDSNDPKVAGGLQSLCWGSAAIGGLLSAYFSGSLLETMSTNDVFLITASLPAIVAFISLFIDEPATGKPIDLQNSAMDGVKTQINDLWKALKQPAVWKPALFLFLWQSTPTSDGAFLYFMTNDLGFGPEFLGRVRLVTAGASLLGVWGYQKYLRSVSIKNILFWTTIASTPLGLIQLLLITHANRSLGIPDGAFVFGDDVVLAILGEFAFLPTLVLAAKICPPGTEAVLFATLMSIFNGASTFGTEIGALLTKYLNVTESNFDNMGLLTIICNLTSLYPLLFIGLLDGIGSKSEAEMEDAGLDSSVE